MPDASQTPVAVAGTGLWRDVRSALRGDRQDYISIPIGRAVFLLAIPMVLEMTMQSLFAVVDVFFVGRLGSEAIAILGLTDSVLSLIYALAVGLCMATVAMIARRVGEKDHEAAAVTATQAIILGVLISIPLSLVGVTCSRQILLATGASPALAEQGQLFTAIILGCNLVILLLFLINAIFRGAGDPALAMRSLWIANGTNLILDPILIFGLGPIPAFGLEGAAVATIIGRSFGVLYQLKVLMRSQNTLRIEARHWRLAPTIMIRLVRVGGVGILQHLVSTASFLGLMRILAGFGENAVAGYTVAVRMIIFVLMPAWGLGSAASTLVGQNLGAGNPDRAERSVWLTAYCSMAFLGIVAVLFQLFAEPLVMLFSPEAGVADIAILCLRTVSYSYLFWGFGMVIVFAFNGAGDTITPARINFAVYWLFQIPLAYFLARTLNMGAKGVFIAIAASQTLLALVGVAVFRRGTWKTQII